MVKGEMEIIMACADCRHIDTEVCEVCIPEPEGDPQDEGVCYVCGNYHNPDDGCHMMGG